MRHSSTLLLTTGLAALLSSVMADGATCNITNLCGSDAPCCSDFGFCSPEHCRGGCNPLTSNTPTSCFPLPLCEDKTYTFADTSRIINATEFHGNVSEHDFTIDNAQGSLVDFLGTTKEQELALYLTQANKGARISTTRYIHYGQATARMKVGHWDGVVVTFIGMSDAKDEVDWEWPGKDSAVQGQSNVFWLGVVNPIGEKHPHSDGFSAYHDYGINWQEDKLEWLIDNKVVRTLRKDQTFDQNLGVFKYPTTPMRLQLSIWPAGIAGTPKGTVEWAGGMINWEDPEYKAAGHFYTLIKSLTVTCQRSGKFAPPADALSYVYGANDSTTHVPTVAYSNRSAMSSAPGTYLTGVHMFAPFFAAGAIAFAAFWL